MAMLIDVYLAVSLRYDVLCFQREVLAYGTRYITGYDTLPELIYPDEVMELVPGPPGTKPDLLVLLPWGPFLKETFKSPAHYQVYQVTLFTAH